MTKSTTARCVWCGERFAIPSGPGRRPRYCRRSHRQRAYEARQVAEARGLAPDEVLVSMQAWHQLRDAIYVAETAAADAQVDLAEAETRDELASIISDLREVISGVVDSVGEPRAVGTPD